MPFGRVFLAAIPLLLPHSAAPAVAHGTANAAITTSHSQAVVRMFGESGLRQDIKPRAIKCNRSDRGFPIEAHPSAGQGNAPKFSVGATLPGDYQAAINACMKYEGIQSGVQGGIKDRTKPLSGPATDVYRTLSAGSQSPIISGNPNNRSISIVADVFEDARGQKVVNYSFSESDTEIRKISGNPNGTTAFESVATRPISGQDATAFRQMKVSVNDVSENTPLDQIDANQVAQVQDSVVMGDNQLWPWQRAAKHNNASTAQGGFNGHQTGVLTSVG